MTEKQMKIKNSLSLLKEVIESENLDKFSKKELADALIVLGKEYRSAVFSFLVS